jgi:hypothetical protein
LHFPDWTAAPSAAILCIEFKILISARVSDIRAAQQLGALAVCRSPLSTWPAWSFRPSKCRWTIFRTRLAEDGRKGESERARGDLTSE